MGNSLIYCHSAHRVSLDRYKECPMYPFKFTVTLLTEKSSKHIRQVCVIHLNLMLFMNWPCMGIIHVSSKLLPLCSQNNVKKNLASMFYLRPHCSHRLFGQSLGMSYTFHFLNSECLINYQRKLTFPYLPSNLLSHCSHISLQRISGRFCNMYIP